MTDPRVSFGEDFIGASDAVTAKGGIVGILADVQNIALIRNATESMFVAFDDVAHPDSDAAATPDWEPGAVTHALALTARSSVHLSVPGGTIRVEVNTDADGNHFVQIDGVDCDLMGEQPGLYYPKPLGTLP